MSDLPVRVLLVVSGLEEVEAESLGIARLLRDAGMEVVYGGELESAERVAKVAMEEDVAVVGVVAENADFLQETAELTGRLADSDPPVSLVVGGSIVTGAEREKALEEGAEEAVSPDASAEEVAGAFRRLASGPTAGS